MGSRIKARIADAAVKLFADAGYYGVSTRDVAKAAKVTEASIYRLFISKKGLFSDALTTVLSQALDPAQFLFIIYENKGNLDTASLLTAALLRWYSSLTHASARLLTQAYFLEEWREAAYAPIDKIIDIVGTTLERSIKPRKIKKTDAVTAGRAAVLALMQFKITYAASYSAREETAAVTAIIHQWLRGVVSTV